MPGDTPQSSQQSTVQVVRQNEGNGKTKQVARSWAFHFLDSRDLKPPETNYALDRQARCIARIRFRAWRSGSGVSGSEIRERRFSCSSQMTTAPGHMRTSKLSRHSPSPQCGSGIPDTTWVADPSTSSVGGDAIRAEAETRTIVMAVIKRIETEALINLLIYLH